MLRFKSRTSDEKKLVVAYKDERVRRHLASGFINKGYRVFSTANGYKALEVTLLENPNLLVVDDRLDVLPTRQLIRIISTNPNTCDIPIIYLSEEEKIVSEFRQVFNNVVTKPFEINEFINCAAAFLKHGRKKPFQTSTKSEDSAMSSQMTERSKRENQTLAVSKSYHEPLDVTEYERLRNNVFSLNSGSTIRTVMITSALSGEGNSTVASNLATTLARNNKCKVLLIEGNLKRPMLHKLYALENNKGLSDILDDGFDTSDLLQRTRLSNLSVITSGKNALNPTEIYESPEFKDLLDNAKSAFNCVIVDSAPVFVYPETPVLASQMDGVILVVQSGKTRWESAQRAKEQLEIAHANILGVVLNKREYIIPRFIYRRFL